MEFKLGPTLREVVISIVVAAIAAIGTLSVARYELKGELANSDVAQSQLIFARMSELEDLVRDMRGEIQILTIENAALAAENNRLKVKVALLETQTIYGPESRTKAVFDLLDSLGRPAWCKGVRENDDHTLSFVMRHVNRVFESEYDITYAKFVGHTDYDLFTEKLADRYHASDAATYQLKGWSEFAAARPDFAVSGQEGITVNFAKFYHKVQGGPELICGMETKPDGD